MLYPGLRRALGIIVIVIAILLIFLSDSKTALGLAFVAPFLAGITLITRKKMRISPAIILCPYHFATPYCPAYPTLYESHIIHAIRRFDFHGSHFYMGFCAI